ncbi:ganglioside-induced differentiation-associated protein 2 isoform X2 [Amia ocellicauda]|uniref:ganglioside-induced differentiation-associated protein 2 isoform X2 n=1 Tax=Amia ocellicauda TaxID=2972642 RepID=UPI003464B338
MNRFLFDVNQLTGNTAAGRRWRNIKCVKCWPGLMDPLGARSQFVDALTLPSWELSQNGENTAESCVTDSHSSQDRDVTSPFPFREDLNRKIVLYTGNVALLNCTAIVNTSNETLMDKNPISDSIHRHAGPELRDELIKLKGCRTGEAKMTKGFNLAARFIIHTVGPKYKAKYRTAAESSLYSCYRNVLQLAKEQGMASVAFCVINTSKRGYPLEDATHIAFRTVRRFLENHGESIETVVFVVTDVEEPVYQKLLPLYFPRSVEEEHRSLPLLPPDIGNSEGEPVVPERQIRIAEKPGVPEEDSEEETLDKDLSFVGSHAFARMEGDVDKQRKLILQGQMSEAALQKQHQRNTEGIIGLDPWHRCNKSYTRWLCRARAEDLSDIAALKALYQTGVDICGRTVMVIVGRNIPVTLIDMEKALLYFIHVMDHIVVKEYVMVYFHTLTGEHNHLDSEFLKKLYDIVDAKYKKNLRAFYFVHPTFRSKVSTWFFTTFNVSGLKDKVHHVDTLQQLFTCVVPEQIDIPPFVLEYDARVNGPYHPSYSSGL